MVVAIGTVSPSAKDTEHSIGTLRALQQLQGTQMSFEEREDILKPKQEVEPWLHEFSLVWFELDACPFYRSSCVCLDLISPSSPHRKLKLIRRPGPRQRQICRKTHDS